MQIYLDLRVPLPDRLQQTSPTCPHVLFGHVDGAVNYSVGRYVEDVAGILPQLRAEGLQPIFVGGTGLYFKVLTEGPSEMPRVSEPARAQWRVRAGTHACCTHHAEISACDPIMAARLRPTDPQRILRALEVFAEIGQSLAFLSARSKPLLDTETCAAILLAPKRDALKAAIDRRFDATMESGALYEAAALGHRGLDPALPVMRALGVPQPLEYIAGCADFETATENAKRDTRAYAKRQFTFAHD